MASIGTANSGGLVELSALGHMDLFFSCGAQDTLFKGSWTRYTNYARIHSEQTVNNAMNASSVRKSSTVAQRVGDLLSKVYWRQVLPGLVFTAGASGGQQRVIVTGSNAGRYSSQFRAAHVPPADLASGKTSVIPDVSGDHGAFYIDDYGHLAIEQAALKIGGQEFDKMSGEFMHAWHNLSTPAEKLRHETLNLASATGGVEDLVFRALYDQEIFGDLPFYHHNHLTKALPLIALQYHEVHFDLTMRAAQSLVGGVGDGATVGGVLGFDVAATSAALAASQVSLVFDIILLDAAERRMFSQQAHEYLIEQCQEQIVSVTNSASSAHNNLPINHPCSELIVAVRRKGRVAGGSDGATQEVFAGDNTVTQSATRWDINRYSDFSGGRIAAPVNRPHDALLAMSLTINGHLRFQLPGKHMREIINANHHSRIPFGYIYTYSFAQDPECAGHDGSLNFSRIDNVQLKFDFQEDAGSVGLAANTLLAQPDRDVYIWFRNKNIKKVMAGMAGITYAN